MVDTHDRETGSEAVRLLGQFDGADANKQSPFDHCLAGEEEPFQRGRLARADGAIPNGDHSVSLADRHIDAIRAISPAALAAYARLNGWKKAESYGRHSDVYVGTNLPEVVLPRTPRLADYANVVSRLAQIFAEVSEMDELELLQELTLADHDAIRVCAPGDHAVTVTDGIALIAGAKDMIAAAARSTFERPKAVYQGRPSKEVSDYLQGVRLGNMERGSFVVTLLPPSVPPLVERAEHVEPDMWLEGEPIQRQATWRLADALGAIREAMAGTIGGEGDAFGDAIARGASANLCDALAGMTAPFETLDLSLTWALTRPVPHSDTVVQFGFTKDESCILQEAARSLRERRVQSEVRLSATIEGLRRPSCEVTLRTELDGKMQPVTAHLSTRDYEHAIDMHREKATVEIVGDLECWGRRRSLLNAHIVSRRGDR